MPNFKVRKRDISIHNYIVYGVNSKEEALNKVENGEAEIDPDDFESFYILEDVVEIEEENRCKHGMFYSGAGACPECGQ